MPGTEGTSMPTHSPGTSHIIWYDPDDGQHPWILTIVHQWALVQLKSTKNDFFLGYLGTVWKTSNTPSYPRKKTQNVENYSILKQDP